jgi:hypothetical protein
MSYTREYEDGKDTVIFLTKDDQQELMGNENTVLEDEVCLLSFLKQHVLRLDACTGDDKLIAERNVLAYTIGGGDERSY